jgi:DNA polymerase-1
MDWKGKMKQFDKDGVSNEKRREYGCPELLYPYNAMDCAGAFQLFELFYPQVQAEPGLLRAYNELKIPGSNLLTDLELNGIPYDVDRACDLLEDEVRPYLQDKRHRVQVMLGMPDFNPNSHQQTAKLWYDDWGITHAMQERRKPGTRDTMERSVDDSARQEIIEGRFRHGHGERDIIQKSASLIDDFKKMDKQRGTYIEGLVPKAERYGRIHCDFNFGPVTGRLSSTNPNLQNITRTKEGLPNIRALFVAGKGKRILQVDYSQAELRTIACLSGDTELSRIYAEGLDLHAIAAARFYGPNFSKEERSKAKNMNFGMFYRQSAATFQEKHGIPEREAAKYIAWSKEEFKRVWDWEREIEQTIKRQGYVESPFGDRRRFHLLTRENAQATYREAINFLPQNTASNFTLRAAIELYPELDKSKYVMMILVHDSIVGECDEDYVDEAATIIKQVMEEQPKKCIGWDLPFTADLSIGPDWGHLEEVELELAA